MNTELRTRGFVFPARTCRGSLVYLRLFTMQSFQRKKEKGSLQKKVGGVKAGCFKIANNRGGCLLLSPLVPLCMSCSVKESVRIALPHAMWPEETGGGIVIGCFLCVIGGGVFPTEFHKQISLALLKRRLHRRLICCKRALGFAGRASAPDPIFLSGLNSAVWGLPLARYVQGRV